MLSFDLSWERFNNAFKPSLEDRAYLIIIGFALPGALVGGVGGRMTTLPADPSQSATNSPAKAEFERPLRNDGQAFTSVR